MSKKACKVISPCSYRFDWYFSTNRDLEHFKAVVKFSDKLFGADREYLYNLLVDKCKGHPKVMESVWEDMQEEGFIPSEELKAKMAKSFDADSVPFAGMVILCSPFQDKRVAM